MCFKEKNIYFNIKDMFMERPEPKGNKINILHQNGFTKKNRKFKNSITNLLANNHNKKDTRKTIRLRLKMPLGNDIIIIIQDINGKIL